LAAPPLLNSRVDGIVSSITDHEFGSSASPFWVRLPSVVAPYRMTT